MKIVPALLIRSTALFALADTVIPPASGAGGPPSIVAHWDFEALEADGRTLRSKSGTYSGQVQDNPVLTAVGGGRPGGGRGFDVRPNNKGYLLVEASGTNNPLNVASGDGSFTITLWQKNDSTSWSSSFYASAEDSGRSLIAHIPWFDSNIIFDTAGCCGSESRINKEAFPGHDYNTWHLYTFVKSGNKRQIWIDGQILAIGDGSPISSTLNTRLFIGSDSDRRSVNAVIDDFAIWKGVLKPHHIAQLAAGVSPSELDTVTVVNTTPVASAQSIITYPGAPTVVTLAGMDFDDEPLTFTVVTPPGKGVLSGTPPLMVYTPNSTASGSDSFTFKVNDGTVDSSPATVSISIQTLSTQSPSKLVAWWNFESAEADGVTVKSRMGGYSGKIMQSAKITAEGAGRPGGGRGFDMSDPNRGHLLHESSGGDNPLNVAAAEDNITITLWQKNVSNPNSSSFWAQAEDTAPSNQAMIPWSDGNIYWDTGGCCGPDTRVSIIPAGQDYSLWHQYSFVKRRSVKEIWIDGKLVKRQEGAKPHTILNTKLYIGGEWGYNPPNGTVDDFAIWRGALSPAEIGRLAAGAVPSELMADSDSDGLPDYWEIQYGLDPGQPNGNSDPDADGFSNLEEYALGTPPNDQVPPMLLGAATTLGGKTIRLDFSEKVDPVTAGDVANYSISPALAVTSALVQGNVVVLTTGQQDQSGVEYTISASNVRDLSKKVIAPGSSVRTYAYQRISRTGALRFSIWRGIPGNELDRLLADPRYPSEPDTILSLGSFNTKEQFRDSDIFAPERENYGARIDGYLTPTESGNYRFFISSDDQSQLFVSTDDTEVNLASVANVTSCCDPFTEPDSPRTSQPIPLVAGQRYYIRFLYKEGCCGDYGQVAWRKEGDTTPAASLTPIPGTFLSGELLVDPQGSYTEITPKPNAVDVSPSAEIVIRHRDGALPWTADNVTLKYDGQTVTPTIAKQGDLLTIRYTPPVISPSGVTHSVILGYLDPQGRPSTYEYGFTSRVYNRPVALDQSISTDEDVGASIVLSGSDLDGDGLSYMVVSQPTKGTLTGSGPNLTYRPSANANGTDTFTFKVNDGTLDSATATVSIVIVPVNDAPIALPGTFQTSKNVAKAIKLGVSDPDILGSFSVVEGNFSWRQARAAAEAQGGHLATFTSQAEWELAKAVVGQRSLWIGAYQGENRVEPAGGWLWVTGEPWGFTAWGPGEPNNVGSEDFAHLLYTPMVNSPTWNDASENSFYARSYLLEMPSAELNQALTFTIVTAPSNGSLSGTPPNLTYTPNSGFVGTDTFTFKVGDAVSESSPATVSIGVVVQNTPPVALSVVRTNTWQLLSSPNGPAVVPMVVAGTDADGDPLTYRLVSAPEGATLLEEAEAGRYAARYFIDGEWFPTPPIGVVNEAKPKFYLQVAFPGTYRFQFVVRDGSADSAVANLDMVVLAPPPVTVNQAPEAFPANDFAVIRASQPQGTPGFLETLVPLPFGGRDPEGNALTYRIVSAPEGLPLYSFNGQSFRVAQVVDGAWDGAGAPTSPLNDGSARWSFPATRLGTYQFTYVVNDGSKDSPVATVNMTVYPVPADNRAPVALAASTNTSEDTSVPITLEGSDADDDWLTFSVVTPPTQGVLTGTAPNLTYTPNTNANGSDSFRFKVNDGYVDSAIATVSIAIAPVADAPVARSSTITTDEDVPVAIVLDVSDPDLPPVGVFTVVEGNFTWTQARTNAESRGGHLATFTSQAEWDRARAVAGDRSLWIGGYQGTSRVEPSGGWLWVTGEPWSFTAWGPGEPNNAGPEDYAHLLYTPLVNASTWNDAPVNFFHPRGYLLESPTNVTSGLTFTVVAPPTKGVLSGVAPNFTYTPNPDANGTDEFRFRVNDGSMDSSVATVTINIRAVNDAPKGEAQSVTLDEDSVAAITLRGSDAEGDTMVFTVVAEPAKGTLSGTPPNLVYTAKTNATGPDAIVFKVDDGSSSSFATIAISLTPINDPPVAQPQAVALPEDSVRTITLRGTDIDTPAANLVFTILTPPTKGSLVGTNGVFTYRPNAHANGPDAFTFKVGDGSADSIPATVSVDIVPVNDAPVALSQGVSTSEDGAVNIVLTGADVDADPLTFSIVQQPAQGSLSGNPPTLTYTPRTNFSGVDSFTFKVGDGTLESPTNGVVSITVTPVNDAPVAMAQSVSTTKNTPRPILLAAVDAENDALTFAIVAQPARGAVSGTAPALTYTPEQNFVGNDSFTFRANDGASDSTVVTVSIRVTATNVAPVALAQSVTVSEDTALPVLLGGTDGDLDPLTFALLAGPTKGTLSGTPPNLVYLPNTNAFGADSFTFVANDGTVDSTPATVSLTITPINDAPVAQAMTVSGPEDSVIPVLLAGSDVDGDAITYTLVGSPAHGTLVGTPPNLSYVPSTNFTGADSLRFKVGDGALDSPVTTVELTVSPVNDPPILGPLPASVLDAGVGLYFNATGTDLDLPAQVLTFSLKSGPAGMSITPGGVVSWLPTGSQRPSTNTVEVELSDGITAVVGSFVVVAKEASLVANFEGSAIDGYIAGATLWFDADLDGVLDPGEPQTVTDRQGDFVLNFDASLFDTNRNGKLDPSEGRIVAEGGVDLSSGQPRVGQLTAPAGSSVITPLTTMVDLVSREGAGLSVEAAEERVRTSLGIPTGISISSYDPVAAAVQGDQRAAAVQLAASTVADTVRLLASVVDGSSAVVDTQTSSAIVSQTLAKKMVAGTEVDLASPATLSSALSQAASAAGTSVSAEVTKAVSTVVADQNLAKESAVANAWNPIEALQSISQVQAVAQSSTATALGDLASGGVTTDEVLLTHTGSSLSAAVAAAPVGDVTGTDRRSGTFTVASSTAVVSESGQALQPLVIARQNGAFGTVRVLLRLEGDSDLLRTNSVIVDFADAVTQRTVDLSSVLRDDLDPQVDRQVSASLTLAANPPGGAVLGTAVTASIRVIDNDAAGSIRFAASTLRASEGREVAVELTRVDGSAGRIQAVVRLFGGSALPGLDYTNSTVVTEFLPGQTRKRVSLGWIDDAIAEAPETVNATLEIGPGSALGASLVIGSTDAVITVDDNDAPNAAPVATGVAPGTVLTVVEGRSINLTLQGTDAETTALTFTPVGVPTKGVLSGRSPNLIYKANLGARGTDSFTYKVNDGELDSALASVTITIRPINLPPTAISQIVTTDEGRAVGLRLSGTDPDGDVLNFRVTRHPSRGVLSGSAADLVYTPNPGMAGVDSFQFRASDAVDDSPDQTVWVVVTAVNDPPVAQAQSVSGVEDQSLVITLTGNDPEGAPLSYAVVHPPGKGMLSGTGSRWVYQPNTNFSGPDSFTFRVNDGSLASATATVTLSIAPVNDAPEALAQVVSSVAGTAIPIVLAGRDPESDPLRFTVVRPPTQGALSGLPPNLVYSATSGARGMDSFTFKVGDGSLESVESTVTIQLTAGNQAPNAVPQSVAVDEGNTRSINLLGMDPEGAALIYSIVSGPTKGSLSGTAPALVYTPAAGMTGADSFTFKVNDGSLDSVVAVVSLEIRENQIPTASTQSVTLAEDTAINILLSGQDPEGKPLTYTVISQPSKGELSGSAPKLTYTPRRDVSGPDSFTFRVSDGVKDSAVALVSLAITEVNDPPVAISLSRESTNRSAVSVLLQGTDAESKALTYSMLSAPTQGTLSGEVPNLVYTPRTNAFGTDSFTYTVNDGTTNSAPATVRIQILVPVSIPVALPQRIEAEDGVPLEITLSGTDSSGLPLTYHAEKPAMGSLQGSGQTIQYTAKPGYRGRDAFSFRVFNGSRYSSSALVEIQVVAKRDKPPVFDGINDATIDEGKPFSLALKASDPEGASMVYSLIRGPIGLTVSPSGLVEWVPSESQGPSTHNVFVSVSDGFHSVSARFSLMVREANLAPDLQSVADMTISPQTAWSIALQARDADLPAQTLDFGLVQGPSGLQVTPGGQVAWTPTPEQAGKTHRVEVFVEDGITRSSKSFQVTVRPVNTAPFFSNLTGRRIRELSALSFRLVGRDSDVPTQRLTFGLIRGPKGLTVSPDGQVEWTPGEDQGPSTNQVVVRVTDDGVPSLGSTNAFDLIVTEANVAPTFALVPGRLIRELNQTSFRLVARDTDLPAQPLTYSLVSGPKGLTVSPDGVVAWTPTEEQGPSTNLVTVRVSDTGSPVLMSTTSFSLIVSEANSAPTLVNAFGRSIFENLKLSSQLIARDSDLPAQKLSFELVSGPRGMTLSTGGLLEWTPSEDQGPSTNTVVIRVSDDALSPATTRVTFVVTVRESNASPVFMGTNLTVAAQGRVSVALQASDSDLPAQRLTYRLETGPAGLTVSTNGLLEWTPTAIFANTTNLVRVAVSDSVVQVQGIVRIMVGPVGSGTGSEAKVAARTSLALEVRPDQSLILRVLGPKGARFQVESSAGLGSGWSLVPSIGTIETLGDDLPVLVPIASGEQPGDFRQFRLVTP
jgi:hypothetical protein